MADPNRPHLHAGAMEVHRLTPYGCTWFDEAGQPYAVVPAASYDHCLVVCLALDSGQQLAAAPVGTVAFVMCVLSPLPALPLSGR